MTSLVAEDSVSNLTDKEVDTLNTYIDKCAEEGVEPTLEGLIMESEKFAEGFDGAYSMGKQLAQTSLNLAGQVSERSDVPRSLVKKASGRYEDANFAFDLAEMAQAALDTVAALDEQNTDEQL